MFLQNRKHVLYGVGILVLLAGAGTAALIYHAENNHSASPIAAADTSYQPAGYQLGTADYAGTPPANYAGAPSASGASDGYYPTVAPPVVINQAPPQQQPVAEPAPGPYSDSQTIRGRYLASGPVYREHHHHHGRSKKHSIEIVVGTAAAGAAIGAIAGGGPGAAIGAIAGGGAGFTYDRLTHNH